MPEETGQERASSERIQETPAPAQDVLYLGTANSSVANSSVATSTDVTRTVPSVVGWPKDLIAYKFLQKPIVYGEECIRNRMALDLFYPQRAYSAIVPSPMQRRAIIAK